MSLDQRIAQYDPRPRLRIVADPSGRRDSIHRQGGRLLPTLIVSRGGAWTGGKV
jgi:hypothetical protein